MYCPPTPSIEITDQSCTCVLGIQTQVFMLALQGLLPTEPSLPRPKNESSVDTQGWIVMRKAGSTYSKRPIYFLERRERKKQLEQGSATVLRLLAIPMFSACNSGTVAKSWHWVTSAKVLWSMSFLSVLNAPSFLKNNYQQFEKGTGFAY